jgi:hypothetical protein
MVFSASRRTTAAITAGVLLASTIWALPQAAVAAEATGSISGTVVGDRIVDGRGYASAWLDVGSHYDVYYGEIEANGSYVISGLPAGSYRVGFNELGIDDEEYGVTTWTEWWDDALSLDDGIDVVVGAAPRTGIDANVDTVRGAVSDPVVSGATVVGGTLKVSRGAWPAGTAVTYAWYANYSLLQFGTSSSLTLGPETLGKRITVEAHGAIDATGYPSAENIQVKLSKDTAPVKAGSLQTSTPSISGTAAVNGTLAVKHGAWTKGTQLSYQWYAAGKKINGATKATYKVPASLVGKNITVKVTGKRTGYTTATTTSKATARVALAGTPTISGTARVGKKLTAKPGTWTKSTSFSYQWYANGKAIRGATKSTYTISSGAKGKVISVKVTGKKPGHTTVAKNSKATAKVR